MKNLIATLAFAADVMAQLNGMTHGNGTSYTTEIVSVLTTVCPSATQLTHNGITYTITEATTLTITNCPCTLTHALTSTPVPAPTPGPSTVLYTSCPPSASGAPPAPPLKSAPPPAACPGGSNCPPTNPLTPIYTTPSKTQEIPGGTGSPIKTTTGPVITFTGAANANRAAGIIAAVGAFAAVAL